MKVSPYIMYTTSVRSVHCYPMYPMDAVVVSFTEIK